ncbi:MAG: dTMP kinase [Alphaproteobacteria bacterium]|jgi:dTMP kinase|nr:dTMP kinase [Alphaproteobacteria bacterium]MCV6599413.1 dTMP kinase [Alphaproteobacteria bacterium]
MFITLEGGDGTGKTTQIKLLKKYLEDKFDKKVVLTKEPGGTDAALEIRKILLQGEIDKWSFQEEMALFYVARSHHIRNLIKPEIEKGNIVISDRFYDSTVAYQGRQDKTGILPAMHDIFVGEFIPDLTIILDIDVREGLKRSFSRDGNIETRMEEKGIAWHEDNRKAFLRIAEENPDRCFVVDASGSIEDVNKKIIKVVEDNARIFSI